MELWKLYHNEIPQFLSQAAQTPGMQRLKQVGMNCGCEYTNFPRFSRCMPYSRFDHSIGVAMIVWHFTEDPAQTLAGLFHDISTPAFAHVVDFLHGDYLKQESTEDGTERMIRQSPQIQSLLSQLHLTTADVCDYHIYPIADNDSPKLSADRLEYTLGNLVQFGFGEEETVRRLYGDLFVGTNEQKEAELQFRSPEKAEAFARFALQCAKVYVSDEDRYAMQMLAELLRDAIGQGILTENDLEMTEPEVIGKLCADPDFSVRWRQYGSYRAIRTAKEEPSGAGWRRIYAKKRSVDPLVYGKGRVSVLSSEYGRMLNEFLTQPQDDWLCGCSEE